MVHANPPPQQVPHPRDLRQDPILRLQPPERLLNEDVHLALLPTRAQIEIRKRARILFAALLGKGEHDDREQLLLLEVVEQVDVEVLVRGVERPRAACGSRADGSSAPARGTAPAAPGRPATPLSTLGRRCPPEPLNGWETCSLAFLVLFAPQRLPCVLVPARRRTRTLSFTRRSGESGCAYP